MNTINNNIDTTSAMELFRASVGKKSDGFNSTNKISRSYSTSDSNPLLKYKQETSEANKTKYKLKKMPIGRGKFGVVYYATDNDGKEYAIKRISISALRQTTLEKFEFEMNISLQMKHINIVKCYETFKTESYWYIVNEFCNGGTFEDLIKNIKDMEPKSKEQLCNYYLIQLKDALQYLHFNNIIHRDLKPQNILITKTEETLNKITVKLADFGFARYFETDVKSKKTNAEVMMSTFCGSPIYMAPEILFDHPYNSKADLWSFGIIAYELLYGFNPFNFDIDMPGLKKMMLDKDIKYEKIYSNDCIELIKKLLEIDCEKRIEWEDFCKHKWFRLYDEEYKKKIDELSDGVVSDSDVTDSDVESIFNESKDADDTNDKKFEGVPYIENYVDSISIFNQPTTPVSKSNVNDYYLRSSPENKEKDFVMVNKMQTNKTKKYKEKESLTGSVFNIMCESVNYIFNLPKSY